MVVLPITQSEYEALIQNSKMFRAYLDKIIEKWPELFPPEIASGYHLHGKRQSNKMEEIKLQRIQLLTPDENGRKIVLTIKPSSVMPYMSGYTDDVEKALYLAHKHAVPANGLTYVFGRNDSYWYRQTTQIGRYSLVETTVQSPERMPTDLLADEKHSRFNGEKCYIATTVGNDCILGAEVSLSADETGLTKAYSTFRDEAEAVSPNYKPKTVNIDGWSATQKVWQSLFPMIVIIECILHAFISIRSRCKKKHKEAWPDIQDKFWDMYDALTEDEFKKHLLSFHDWASKELSGTALEAVQKLKRKTKIFQQWYKHPTARRTSNMLDRHMEPMDRMLSQRRYFHGHLATADLAIRSWSLAHNFLPYCKRAKISNEWYSPAEKLNGKKYHDNWLHNLLVSTSNSRVIMSSHQL